MDPFKEQAEGAARMLGVKIHLETEEHTLSGMVRITAPTGKEFSTGTWDSRQSMHVANYERALYWIGKLSS